MCKIIKAEMVGNDLHIQCECKDETELVYGTDKNFTAKKAIEEFKLRHAAKSATIKPRKVARVVGTEIE